MLEYKDDPKVAGALEGMSYEQLSEFMKEDMGKEVNELLHVIDENTKELFEVQSGIHIRWFR